MKTNIFTKSCKTLIPVILALFLIVFSIYAAEGDKPKSAEEIRKEAAAVSPRQARNRFQLTPADAGLR